MALPELTRTARGLGAAVRDQPPRPLRARRSACTTRSPRPTAPRIVSVSSRGHLRSPVVFDDLHFAFRDYEPWRLRPVQDRQRAVRGRGDPALGGRRHHRQRADPGRDRDQPAAPHLGRSRLHGRGARAVERPAASSRRPSRAPRRRSCSPPRRSSRASAAATSRTATRPGSIHGPRPARAGVAPYALDPDNAERLWDVSPVLIT